MNTNKKDQKKIYKYTVYVIELDNPMTVYIGQSCWSPEERFKRHRSGIKSSKYVRKASNPKLRPDLYKHLPIFDKRVDAEKKEVSYAVELEKRGFKVFGGH